MCPLPETLLTKQSNSPSLLTGDPYFRKLGSFLQQTSTLTMKRQDACRQKVTNEYKTSLAQALIKSSNTNTREKAL